MSNLARKLRLIDFCAGFRHHGRDRLARGDGRYPSTRRPLARFSVHRWSADALPIGYVYGKLVKLIPDAAAEVAYTARFFPSGVSFGTGWMMFLLTVDVSVRSSRGGRIRVIYFHR